MLDANLQGTNLLQTLTHELGHSLGLSHSDVNSAVMAPFYKGWQPDFKLDPDDIQAIQVTTLLVVGYKKRRS